MVGVITKRQSLPKWIEQSVRLPIGVREPSPILVLMPTEADCRDYKFSNVEPLFIDSPALSDARKSRKRTKSPGIIPDRFAVCSLGKSRSSAVSVARHPGADCASERERAMKDAAE
jgi:hypothetical protein